MDDKILASILHLVKASHPPTCEECRVEHVSEKEEETRNHSTAHPPREVRESHRHTEEGPSTLSRGCRDLQNRVSWGGERRQAWGEAPLRERGKGKIQHSPRAQRLAYGEVMEHDREARARTLLKGSGSGDILS